MNAKLKKGFTIVELVIVIAVIAILAAVMIPTAISIITKSQVSADTQLVKNLNTILTSNQAIDGKNTTAHDAFLDAEEAGYNVEKLTPTATKHHILWDSSLDRFVLLDADGKEVFPKDNKTSQNKVDLFEVYAGEVETSDEYEYSIYLAESAYTNDEQLVVNVGIDAGKNTNITNISYTTDATQSVTIYTNGGALAVSAPNSDVAHYGTASVVDVKAVATSSFHEHGTVNVIKVEVGRFVAEATAVLNVVYVNTAATHEFKIDTASFERVPTVTEANNRMEAAKAGDSLFSEGFGSEKSPYIISSLADMQKITQLYDKGYFHFKVADGVKTFDCNGWNYATTSVKLHGSFDGNGVTFTNVTAPLFHTAGYQNNKEDIVIKNFSANLNIVGDRVGVVRNLYNSGTTTFENVNVHGYIEGAQNLGSFYQYGTCNYDDIGKSYTVKFVNAKSDVTIVATTGNTSGGMLGHGFEGAGNKLSIEIDANSGYTGTIMTNATSNYLYMAMCSNANFYLNGVETSRYDNKYSKTKAVTKVNPVLGENGYTVELVDGAAKLEVSVAVQLSAHDAQGNHLVNQGGINITISTAEYDVSGYNSYTVFGGAVTDMQLFNNTEERKYEYAGDGVLKIYTATSTNYGCGWSTLQVRQYDESGNILAVGTVTLYTIKDAN